MARGIGPPPLASLKSPYSGVHLMLSDFFVFGCSFIYLCGTGTACCNLLTWAETKWVRQLIIHGTTTSSNNMVMTGISRGISQLQISPHQEIPQREILATLRTLQLILWDPVGSEKIFLLRTMRLYNLSWRYLPRNNMSHSRWLKFLLVQGSEDLSPVCFRVQPLPSCVGSWELSWEILSTET